MPDIGVSDCTSTLEEVNAEHTEIARRQGGAVVQNI
jgi:hypothetical protein